MAVKSIYFDSAGLSCANMCPAIGVTGYLKGRDRQTQPLRILVSWRIIERRYIHRQTHESSLSARAGESVITRRRGTREIRDRALEMEKLTGGIIKLPFRRERDLSVHHVPICVSDNRCEYRRDVAPFQFSRTLCYRDIFPTDATRRFGQRFNDSNTN